MMIDETRAVVRAYIERVTSPRPTPKAATLATNR
jgi:hypothetical protein